MCCETAMVSYTNWSRKSDWRLGFLNEERENFAANLCDLWGEGKDAGSIHELFPPTASGWRYLQSATFKCWTSLLGSSHEALPCAESQTVPPKSIFSSPPTSALLSQFGTFLSIHKFLCPSPTLPCFVFDIPLQLSWALQWQCSINKYQITTLYITETNSCIWVKSQAFLGLQTSPQNDNDSQIHPKPVFPRQFSNSLWSFLSHRGTSSIHVVKIAA